MANLLSLSRRPPTDLIAAPISAFESETQAVIQRTSPYSEHVILHVIAAIILVTLLAMSVIRLDRVVSGTGRILPAGGSLFVQPLDKAIVTGILVRNGDVVRKGQVLATLDPTFAAADLKDLQQKLASSDALVARLKAEQEGRAFTADPASPYQVLQASISAQRRSEYLQSINDFDSRIRAASSSVAQSQQDATDYRRRVALAKELEQQQTALQARGFGSRVRTIAATDNRIETERLLSDSQNQSTQSFHDLQALRAQREAYAGKWRDDLTSQLVAAQNDLDTAQQAVAKASKVKDLSNLVAPQDAVVLSVGQASVGSVIDPSTSGAAPLFTLVPLNGTLEAEVKVPAKDVGFIRRGDKVAVKLDAYQFTSHGVASGVIKTISEGSFTTDDEGRAVPAYFRVRILFTDVRLHDVPKSFRLIPGMTLTADALVGKRTVMSYLLEGALRTGSEAMREP